MNEVLLRAEIEARFPDEWILVTDPLLGPDLSVRSGVVAAHSKIREEVELVATKVESRHIAFWYSGDPIPAGMKVLSTVPRAHEIQRVRNTQTQSRQMGAFDE